jgi:hypothetical protein
MERHLQDAIRDRRELRLPLRVDTMLDYQEHSIAEHGRSSFSICGSKTEALVDRDFMEAFEQLDLGAKQDFYRQDVAILKNIMEDSAPGPMVATLEASLFLYEGIIGSWHPVRIKVEPLLLLMTIDTDQRKTETVSLTHFMLRRSENKDKKAWVVILYRLNRKIIRLGCDSAKEFEYWFGIFRRVQEMHRHGQLSIEMNQFKSSFLKDSPAASLVV